MGEPTIVLKIITLILMNITILKRILNAVGGGTLLRICLTHNLQCIQFVIISGLVVTVTLSNSKFYGM